MAANPESVTERQIASIADQISREGRTVSPITVWSELRDVSIIDVATGVQKWRDAHLPVVSNELIPEPPQVLYEAVSDIAQRIWNTAREQTEVDEQFTGRLRP